MRIVSLLAVSALLGGTAVSGCSSGTNKVAKKIVLEAAGVIAPGAFIPAPDADLKGVKAVPVSGGKGGNGPLGGIRGRTRCDKAKLVAELTRDRVKGTAWAKIRKIPFEKIAEFVQGLSEGFVLQDTLVRNHNYKGDGVTESYLSVVQAGTALLFDDFRNPVVKCNCGNPLLQPERNIDRQASTYTGDHWEAFQNSQVTVVAPQPLEEGPLKALPLVDPFQPGTGFDRPVGGDGSNDSPTRPVPTPTLPAPTRSGSTGSPGTPAPSGTKSGTPSGSAPPPPTPTGPTTGGSVTSRPPTGVPSTPSRTTPPPRTGAPTLTHKPQPTPTRPAPATKQPTGPTAPVAPPRTASAPAPVHTTAAASRPPKTAAPPPERSLAPPPKTAAPPVERTVAPPPKTAAPPVERTVAPPPKTAAPPAATAPAASGRTAGS
ncbi:hypothetical protein LE181_28245 [Streptomyces sp. SCA3-4]|uniref:DUF6777 domain-containing protein n=1 Tax=Streptomyces sichuanensis TaxID=2871810 RepID=UPI001CE3AFDB|nr:DUF6777 domain-containing protein [Streptomyces sichuanensis]MCA6096041.1 hypothetical protein [Streptomyces sichuanensis]